MNSDGTPIQTVFDSNDDAWIVAAQQVADEAQKVVKYLSRANNQCIIFLSLHSTNSLLLVLCKQSFESTQSCT